MNRLIRLLAHYCAAIAGCKDSGLDGGPLPIEREFRTIRFFESRQIGNDLWAKCFVVPPTFLGADVGGRIVESFSSTVKRGKRGKLKRSMDLGSVEVSEEEDVSSEATLVEFEPVFEGNESRISIRFVYERFRGEFEPRKVTSLLIIPHQGGVIAASWREGGNLQFLYPGAEARDVNAVTRVRRIAGK